MLHLSNGIEDALVFVRLQAGQRRLLRLKRAAAGGDKQRLRFDDRVRVRADAKKGAFRRAQDLHPVDHLAQVEFRLEGMNLLHQTVDQLLAADDRKARNVVDRLLGIELSALAASFRQNVDQVALHVEKAELEDRKEADGPSAHNRDVR